MSYASKLEANYRDEAFKQARGKARLLEERLQSLDSLSGGLPNPSDIQQAWLELHFLERLVAADVRSLDAAALRRDLQAKLPDYRKRLEVFPSPDAARNPNEPSGRPWQGGRSSSSLSQLRTSRSNSSLPFGQTNSLSRSERTGIAAMASFMGVNEDEVRVLAAEGQLEYRLGENPMLKVGAQSNALLFREYTEADEEEAQQRRTNLILELKDEVVRLHEIVQTVDTSVQAAQAPLNQLEENMIESREEVNLAVGKLQNANRAQLACRALIFLLLAAIAVMLSWKFWKVGFVVACGCGLFVASCLLFLSISSWRLRMVAQMQHQLPRCFKPMPEAEVDEMRRNGEEAERRLLQALDAEDAWVHLRYLPFLSTRLALARKPSVPRYGGYAYRISFTVPMSARRVYNVFKKLSVANSIDTFSRCAWSRPLDSSTSFRYLILSNAYMERDFFLVNRAAKVNTPGTEEQYVIAQMSLGRDDLHSSTLPTIDPAQENWHGNVEYMGMRISDCNDPAGSARIEMAADVDPNAPCCCNGRLADIDIRIHMFAAVRSLLKELHRADVLQVRHSSRERMEAVVLQEGERLWSDSTYVCRSVPSALAGAWLYRHRFRGPPPGNGEVYAPDGARVFLFGGRFRQGEAEEAVRGVSNAPLGPATLGWEDGPTGMVAAAEGNSAAIEISVWQRSVAPGETLPWPTTSSSWSGTGIIVANSS